jgi:hypothetical protein
MDPALYTPIISGALGISGALIGAASAYQFNRRLNKSNTETANIRLSILLAYEITGHASALANEIDYLLPYWMFRGRTEGVLESAYSNRKRPTGSRPVFDSYVSELLHLPFALQVLFHYGNIDLLNHLTCNSEDIVRYGHKCQEALLSAMGTLDLIFDNPRVRRTLKKEKGDNLWQVYQGLIPWCESRLELAKLKYAQLISLERDEVQDSDLVKRYNNEWRDILSAARDVRQNSAHGNCG